MPVEEVRVWKKYELASGKQARKLSYSQEPDASSETSTTHLKRRKQVPDQPSRTRQHSTVFSRYNEQLGYDQNDDSDIRDIYNIEEGVDINVVDNIDDKIKDSIARIFSVYFERHQQLNSNEKEWEKDEPSLVFLKHFYKFFKLTNGTIPSSHKFIMKKVPFPEFFVFVELCLRGVGQVVFQNNPITGLFILIGLFVQSPRVAVHGVIGTTSGTIIAYLLGFEKGLTRSGLFGYNSVLCGLAISTFNNPDEDRYRGYSVAIIISTVVFSCFSSILFVFMGKLLIPYKVTPLTLPFNVSVIIYLLATVNMSRVETAIVGAQIGNGADLDLEVDVTITIQGFFAGCIRGCGQIFLADNIVSGALVLTGIALCSRISAMGALFGSTIGATVAVLIGVPGVQVESGLFGFNSCLTVIAMYMFYTPSQTVFIVSILAASMTVIVQQSLTTLLQPYGIPFMTLPFCFAALPFIVIQGTSSLIAVPLSSITVPEDHLKKVRCLHEGFYFLKEALYPDNARDFLQKNSQDIRITNDLDKTKHARFNLSNVSEEDTLENDTLENDTKATYEAASDFGLSKQRFNTSNILSRKKIICNKFQRNDPKWVLDAAPKIFEAIDSAESRSISIEALQYVLQQNGLHSKSGTRFITLVIRIMDIKKSSSIGPQEWVKLCLLSVELKGIRKKISKFVDFVNSERRESIYIRELNAALNYLGKPGLSETDLSVLFSVLDIDSPFDTQDDVDVGVNVIDLINYVTISKVKTMIQ